MVITMCECNLNVVGVEKMPPHVHVMAGLVGMPNGEKRWLNGAITEDQQEMIQMEVRFTRGDLVAFVAKVRGGYSEADRRRDIDESRAPGALA